MERFSERIGITKPLQEVQISDMDQQLRNSLWNVILLGLRDERYYWEERDFRHLYHRLALHFFKIPLKKARGLNERKIENWIKEKFDLLQWYEVYNLIEYLVQTEKGFYEKNFQKELNYVLETKNSGYRLVNGKFVPIISEQEIKEIEEALEKTTTVGIKGAREHLSCALSFLAQKPEPDYRNSIKESISAVESLVKQLSGKHSGALAPALKELSKRIPIHGALEDSFNKLYGYTSDEDGIRHAILEDSNVGYDEAKFMLVACSSFVNFLFSKAQKAGLLKEG